MKVFAETLKELREEMSISQAALAIALNISNGTIGFWETNKSEPTASNLVLVANFFNVSVDYLLGKEEYRPNYKTNIIQNTKPTEIQRIHDDLTPLGQQKLIGYGNRLLDEQNEKTKKNRA